VLVSSFSRQNKIRYQEGGQTVEALGTEHFFKRVRAQQRNYLVDYYRNGERRDDAWPLLCCRRIISA
jgi:hypothetical protein